MERASTVDNPACHCITIHGRDGFDMLPINTVKRWAPDVPVTGRGPYHGSWYDLMASRYLIFSFAMVAWLPDAIPSVEDYAADLASRLLGAWSSQRLSVSTACP